MSFPPGTRVRLTVDVPVRWTPTLHIARGSRGVVQSERSVGADSRPLQAVHFAGVGYVWLRVDNLERDGFEPSPGCPICGSEEFGDFRHGAFICERGHPYL